MIACGSSSNGGATDTEPAPDQCVGGVVVNGICEGKCKPELCLEGNTCVGNKCVLKCDSHLACYPGTQDCAPAIEDDTNAEILACTANGKRAGSGAACPFGVECSQFGVCPDGSSCNLLQCDGQPELCVRNEEACAGNPNCTTGRCPNGNECTVLACPVSECSTLTCVSNGEGDADAYCSQADCTADADCPSGYECGTIRDPHNICNTDPLKGNNFLCGTTDEPCIDPSTFGAGNTYSEGSVCLLRKTCIKRTPCSPCALDLDCSLVAGQRCVNIGGEQRCARTCNGDSDCELDYRCDAGACTPRFGKCVGQGKFCEPCLNDNDCGGPGTGMFCYQTLSGQRACLDLAFSVACSSNSDCPTSPSGLSGRCQEGRCFFPINRDGKETCW